MEQVNPSTLKGVSENLSRKYYFVGPMPEAVNHFAETDSGRETRQIQEEIIKSDIMDFAKHARSSDIPKLTLLWDSIPKQKSALI